MKTIGNRKLRHMLMVLVMLVSILPMAGVTSVFADDGAEPAAEAPPAVEEAPAAEEPAETAPAEQAPAEDAAVEEPAEVAAAEDPAEAAPAEEPADEAAAEQPAAEEEPAEEAVVEEPAEEEASVAEKAAALGEADVTVADESGEALPMASQEAADALAYKDPFYWDATEGWVGYTASGTGCPVGVDCRVSTGVNPFQDAIDAVDLSEDGNIIYVAGGNYDTWDIVVRSDDYDNSTSTALGFKAFHTVTITGTGKDDITIDASGYAVVNQLTLNQKVDLANTHGFYADHIVVNGRDGNEGYLDDAFALVNSPTPDNPEVTIEADIVIGKTAGVTHFRDPNHSESEVEKYELECGDPYTVIYYPIKYRMEFKDTYHPDTIAFYTGKGDNRSDYDLPTLNRLDDLLIGAHYSREGGLTNDEEQLFWYLLGYEGGSSAGSPSVPVGLTGPDTVTGKYIVDGEYDYEPQYWDAWFLFPKYQYDSANNTYPGNTEITEERAQLTFTLYDPRPIDGCTDPAALNYDPNATFYDDALCVYESVVETPPDTPAAAAAPPAGLVIPVTGAGGPTEDIFLIPVTGADGSSDVDMNAVYDVLFGTMALFAVAFIVLRNRKFKRA